MTQEDLNQFLAVLMYGLAHNSVHYHECCYGTKQTKEQTYQVARIPVFKVDGFDTLQQLFATNMEEYPMLNYYFHCDQLMESRKQYENGLNQFARNYHLEFKPDRKYSNLYFKITSNIKHKIQSDLLNEMIQKQDSMQYPIDEMMVGIEREMIRFAHDFYLTNFFSRLKDRDIEQRNVYQKGKAYQRRLQPKIGS